MSRRWINSVDVEFDAVKGSILTDQASPASLAGGTKTVAAAAVPEALVAAATPCRFVWIGARVDGGGNPLNSAPCFIGDAVSQNIPVMPSNYEGLVIRIDDAAKLFVRVAANANGVTYRIFA